MRLRLLLPPILLLAACEYQAPLDPDAEDVSNALSGSVLVEGVATPSDVYIFVFAADDPPPPLGTGSPVNFSAVPSATFTGAGAGLQSAPWTISQVPDGDWLVTALMDVDGDFQPLLTSNAGQTCGDYVGAHIGSLSEGDVQAVTVEGGELRDDITVVVATALTIERPAFRMVSSTVDQNAPGQTFTLDATGISSPLITLTGPFDGTDPCDTMFLVWAMDSDSDGAADPHPNAALAAAGALDIWPRVYLQYTGEGDTALDEGESWASEAVIDPTPVYTGDLLPGVPSVETTLDLFYIPAAAHTLADGSSETISAPNLPRGAWSVTVVQASGQTWTVPNEVAAFPALDSSFLPETQAAVLTVE